MQKLKNKTMTILIALLLITSIFSIFITEHTADAHTPAWQFPTHAFIIGHT